MKYFLPISVLAALILIVGFVLGSSLENKIVINDRVTIEAPGAVVWNTISNFDEYHKWQKSIHALNNYNNTARQISYYLNGKTLMVNQQIRIRKNANSIDFIQIGKEAFSQLQNFGGNISLTFLADGSTEVEWTLTYSAESVTLKLINYFYIEEKLRSLVKSNLASLKSFVEH
jgi:uncharacterized membrane protein